MKVSPRYAILTVTLALQTVASLFQQGVGAIQPMIARSLHLDHQGVGLIVAALAAGSATFAAMAGIAVDYFGERAVLLWSGIAMGVTLCAAGAVPHLAWLTVWLFFFGMAYGTSAPSGGRAILLWFTRDRGFAMAIRQAGVPLGGVLGSLLLPAIALHWGYQAAIVTSGVICIVVTIVGVHNYHTPAEHAERERRPIVEVLRGMLAIVFTRRHIYFNITCWTLVAAQYTALSFLAIALISEKHAPLTIAVTAMVVFQVGAVVGRLVWGTVSDRLFAGDRVGPMIVISVITCAALLWLARPAAEPAVVSFAIAAVLGFSAAAWNGLWATAQAELGGHQLAGSSLGASLTVIQIVGGIVPPLFGAVVDRANFTTAWELLAIVVALGTIPAFFARRLLYEHRCSALTS